MTRWTTRTILVRSYLRPIRPSTSPRCSHQTSYWRSSCEICRIRPRTAQTSPQSARLNRTAWTNTKEERSNCAILVSFRAEWISENLPRNPWFWHVFQWLPRPSNQPGTFWGPWIVFQWSDWARWSPWTHKWGTHWWGSCQSFARGSVWHKSLLETLLSFSWSFPSPRWCFYFFWNQGWCGCHHRPLLDY